MKKFFNNLDRNDRQAVVTIGMAVGCGGSCTHVSQNTLFPSKLPFSSLTVSNYDSTEFRTRNPRKCFEYYQLAQAPSANPNFYDRSEKTDIIIGVVSILVGLVGGVIYLLVIGKLRTLDWYKENVSKFSKRSLVEDFTGRLNRLETDQNKILADQKLILENQNKILDFITNNQKTQ